MIQANNQTIRKHRIKKHLDYWQAFLNLTDWDIDFVLTEFKRKDGYNQSGDIKVDLKNKKATVLIKKQATGKDNVIVLHELIHLVFWPLDSFSEPHTPKNKKDKYLELLEDAVMHFEKVLIEADKR